MSATNSPFWAGRCLPANRPRPPPLPPRQDSSKNDPRKRLRRFFESLYACLAKGARAVLQIYPANTEQAAMMTNAAMRAGFNGGLVVDFPHRWAAGWVGGRRRGPCIRGACVRAAASVRVQAWGI